MFSEKCLMLWLQVFVFHILLSFYDEDKLDSYFLGFFQSLTLVSVWLAFQT